MRRETEAALAAVAAAQEAIAHQGTRLGMISKSPLDITTEADLRAEDAIRATLTEWYPHYVVVGEERGGAEQANAPYWLVDPICGTRGFASGLPLYCTNIALIKQGEVVVAVVRDGGTGDTYLGEQQQGAWVVRGNAAPTRVSSSDASAIVLVDTGGGQAGLALERAAAVLRSALVASRWYVWMLGSTVVYPWLAGGKVAAVAQFRTNGAMHQAAGGLVAREAGCVVTDVDGRPWNPWSGSVLAAATPALHRELRELIATTEPR